MPAGRWNNTMPHACQSSTQACSRPISAAAHTMDASATAGRGSCRSLLPTQTRPPPRQSCAGAHCRKRGTGVSGPPSAVRVARSLTHLGLQMRDLRLFNPELKVLEPRAELRSVLPLPILLRHALPHRAPLPFGGIHVVVDVTGKRVPLLGEAVRGAERVSGIGGVVAEHGGEEGEEDKRGQQDDGEERHERRRGAQVLAGRVPELAGLRTTPRSAERIH